LRRRASEKFDNRQDASSLHPREVQVLALAAKGIGNKTIASQLCISERTVQTHLANIFKKLNVGSRTEAILHALKQGWITLDTSPEETK
jgi:two-component system, NarL family, response regulator LiaR